MDHLVLTIADVERTVGFYSRVLGMEARDVRGCPDGSPIGVSRHTG